MIKPGKTERLVGLFILMNVDGEMLIGEVLNLISVTIPEYCKPFLIPMILVIKILKIIII